jgi:hypothetical protein
MFEKARRFIEQRLAARAADRAARVRGYPAARPSILPAGLYGGRQMNISEPAPYAIGVLRVETQPVDDRGEATGPWDLVVDHANLVVRQAESIMAQMAIGAANSALSYIELGDPPFPATPPQLSDISLQASTGQRKSVTLTAVGNVVQAQATWLPAEGNGFTYTEAGLFNGLLGSGLMFARKVFNPITKTAAFQMRFTWFITFLVNTQGGDCSGVSLIGPSTVAAYTIYVSPAGGENSVAATFDFTVGANHVDAYLNGARLVVTKDYNEAGSGALNAPIGGPPLNKGINLVFSLDPGDEVFLIQRTLA